MLGIMTCAELGKSEADLYPLKSFSGKNMSSLDQCVASHPSFVYLDTAAYRLNRNLSAPFQSSPSNFLISVPGPKSTFKTSPE